MTDAGIDEAQLAEWEAAANARYESLRSQVFVALSETCTFPHVSRAADAAAEAVKTELLTSSPP